ncbi:MAG TPA: hypothetical protein VIG51_00130, partial [Candidatus Baltobacteraceae bacterium]
MVRAIAFGVSGVGGLVGGLLAIIAAIFPPDNPVAKKGFLIVAIVAFGLAFIGIFVTVICETDRDKKQEELHRALFAVINASRPAITAGMNQTLGPLTVRATAQTNPLSEPWQELRELLFGPRTFRGEIMRLVQAMRRVVRRANLSPSGEADYEATMAFTYNLANHYHAVRR